jgi:hypothetical protein
MLSARQLFDSMTVKPSLSSDDLAIAVEALQECAEAVTACSVAMLAEADAVELLPAVRRDLDCADVVDVTRRVLTRGTGPDSSLLSAQLEACLVACERSHESCGQHADRHEHCRICADATQRCADMCRNVMRSLHV